MTATLTALFAVHAVAFGALLILSRRDVVLLDDAFAPIARSPRWQEQTVPADPAVAAPIG